MLSILQLMFISFFFFRLFSFAFPIPLAFCQTICTTLSFSGYFSQGLNHSSSVWVAICTAQSHPLECGVLSWGRWSSLVPSAVSWKTWEPPEGGSGFEAVIGPCGRLMSSHELPVRQTNILTSGLWTGDPILFSKILLLQSFGTCQMDEKHKSGDLPSNQHCPPRCQTPAHSLAVRTSGICSTAADSLATTFPHARVPSLL